MRRPTAPPPRRPRRPPPRPRRRLGAGPASPATCPSSGSSPTRSARSVRGSRRRRDDVRHDARPGWGSTTSRRRSRRSCSRRAAAAALRERGRGRRARHGRDHQRPELLERRDDLPDRRQRPGRRRRSAPRSRRRSFGLADGDTGNGHIANCIAGCDYLYTTGTSAGLCAIYDIRDLDNPRFVKTFPLPGNGFTHDGQRRTRTASPGSRARTATFGFDTTDPLNPQLVLRSDESVTNPRCSSRSRPSAGAAPGSAGR